MKEKIKFEIELFVSTFIAGAGFLLGMHAVQALF